MENQWCHYYYHYYHHHHIDDKTSRLSHVDDINLADPCSKSAQISVDLRTEGGNLSASCGHFVGQGDDGWMSLMVELDYAFGTSQCED